MFEKKKRRRREGKRPAVIRIWNTPEAKMIIATILVRRMRSMRN